MNPARGFDEEQTGYFKQLIDQLCETFQYYVCVLM